ncbi:D-isomer specific 2-hydroxyacid dehydrogenase family protein [Corynebacterium sp. TA-R-1]|uniref:D-isomer specific 2-hydroxyacid dehydrogenase family protein n=1 Tax=Corynebacterium stercoris TaxID=2943490 RepID=A0ABT1FYP8_9CORY|nr:D-isomer specific 2-hydroxyacid dehydrogenase family protein [Corynebacterium stercoris]MCP1386889.1 D-isomer specific 2-hydroxyacid dehydrogenase family protein [Corynebacterium stercoris]
MKFAFLPEPWDESVADLEAAGHELVSLDDNPDMLVFRGTPDQFPEELPKSVKVVQNAFAGMDALREAGTLAQHDVRWANAGGLYDDTVAESTLALLLAVLHRHKAVSREWNQQQLAEETDFLFDDKKLALIGAGGIGKKLIEFIAPFGVEVTAVNRSGNPVDGAAQTVKMSEADDVWASHDVFVLLAPLTEETKSMVDAEVLAKMKPSAVVVNVGRGPLVDTGALADALQLGTIAGAGLDVTDPEPLPADHPLWDLDNCIITPHTANVPRFMARRLGKLAAENWEDFEAGKDMRTEVDVDAGY